MKWIVKKAMNSEITMAVVDRASFLIEFCMERVDNVRDILAWIGLAYTAKTAFQITWELVQGYRIFVKPMISGTRESWKEKYGQWAVVTGSTDGIGKAYACQLAERGVNLILISRNLEKLTATAAEIGEKYEVLVSVIDADFSQGKEVYEKISKETEGKEVGILVNNVGVMNEYPEYFAKLSSEIVWKMVMVNVGAVTMMTHLFLPGMVRRKKGAIVNLSSSSSIQPLPFMSVYSASKIYIDYFSRIIRYEYGRKGIEVQSLIPFFIQTTMTSHFSNSMAHYPMITPNSETYCKHAISTLGVTGKTTGYWAHGFQYLFTRMVPEWIWLNLGGDMQLAFRKEGKQRKRINQI